MYFATVYEDSFINFKESAMSKTVLFICFLRVRTTEIEIYSFHGFFREEFFKIFSLAHQKFKVGESGFSCLLHSADYNVTCHFDGNIVYIGISFCRFCHKATLTASDFKMNGIIIAEYFHCIKSTLLCFTPCLGGVVNKKYFEGLVSYDKIEVTVDIAPWVAYVQVPDVIVVDPPKTGDATVLVGIVMAIVAAAGVVVFNKVRA